MNIGKKSRILLIVLFLAAVLTRLIAGENGVLKDSNTKETSRPEEQITPILADENVVAATDAPATENLSLKKHIVILKMLDETGRQGTKGRLVFDNTDFSVAIFESDQYEGPDAQVIVNATDSAVWFMWFGSQSPIIADHCNQGFDIIKECEPGDICYIIDGDNYQKYACVGVDPDGINERDNMYLSSGYNFMRDNDPGFLYMYTCSKEGDSYHITVAIWTPVEEDE